MTSSRHPSRPSSVIALVAVTVCACTALQACRDDRTSATRPTNPVRAATGRPATGPASTGPASTGPAATAPADALLTVTVTGLRSRKGDLVLGVFTQADGFPNVAAKSVHWEVKPADADAVTFTTRLPPGRYAAGVLHDENRSRDMDTLAGIPREGYGVTNNPKPRFRKATFDEATFDLPPGGAERTISVQYF